MDLGLGNLSTLKTYLLNAALQAQSTYDAAIIAIGKGVAAQFDKHCNRGLARLAGAIDEFTADRRHWYLNRYPVEVITTVQSKTDDTTGWVTETDRILVSALNTGFLHFGGMPAAWPARLRITYTGGYWYDTLEPTDLAYPTTQPTGTTALPADVRIAWLQQCSHIWASRDKLGIGLGKAPDQEQTLAQVELLPQVTQLLASYRRYMVT